MQQQQWGLLWHGATLDHVWSFGGSKLLNQGEVLHLPIVSVNSLMILVYCSIQIENYILTIKVNLMGLQLKDQWESYQVIKDSGIHFLKQTIHVLNNEAQIYIDF